MKGSVLARPNLKLFLLGALLLLALQDLLTRGHSQGTLVVHSRTRGNDATSEQQLNRLLARARQTPSSESYMQVSVEYERRGDMKKAVLYLRRAQKLEQFEPY